MTPSKEFCRRKSTTPRPPPKGEEEFYFVKSIACETNDIACQLICLSFVCEYTISFLMQEHSPPLEGVGGWCFLPCQWGRSTTASHQKAQRL